MTALYDGPPRTRYGERRCDHGRFVSAEHHCPNVAEFEFGGQAAGYKKEYRCRQHVDPEIVKHFEDI